MAAYIKNFENKLKHFDFIDSEIQNFEATIISKNESIDELRYIIYKHSHKISENLLLKLLKHKDIYVSFKACSLLTQIYEKKEHRKEYLTYFRYMFKEDITYEEKNQLIILFTQFLSCKTTIYFDLNKRKTEILKDDNFMAIFKNFICIKELQYNLLLLIYIFSFNFEYLKYIDVFFKPIICILKDRNRIKILRICYFLIVNILKQNYNFSINIIWELRKITLNLCEMNIGDEQLCEHLKISKQILQELHDKYNFKNYLKDLYLGILEEHDFHYDENFWINGLPEILKNKVEIVKILKKYLKSHNNDWICLACNDVYMLIKACPEIYSLVSKHKVRDVLFELTRNENDEIRFRAIQALYACIFTEWN